MKVSVPFAPGYEVDELGVVYGKRSGKPLKPSINHAGYEIVNLMIDNHRKGFSVHTIVARTFMPDHDEEKSQVNHINGIKTDNRLENLEWATSSENILHSFHVLGQNPNILRRHPVIARSIKDGEVLRFPSLNDAGEWLDKKYSCSLSKCQIWRVLKGRRRSVRGYEWFYDDDQKIALALAKKDCRM